MKKSRFQILSFVIVFVVVVTILIQGYWNYRNYEVNKQHFLNDVQVALDNGVEAYYANLAKHKIVTSLGDSLHRFSRRDSLNGQSKAVVLSYNQQFQLPFDSVEMDTALMVDTVIQLQSKRILLQHKQLSHEAPDLRDLTAKILISLESDQMDTVKLKSAIDTELARKGLSLSYLLVYHPFFDQSESTSADSLLTATANPAYLPPGTLVKIQFPNNSIEILKRGITGITISLLTALVIIAVLIYLYRIIRDQKDLARMKDDLISNITHEFKTPIATVISALEGIERFNQEEDKEKTKKYLGISAVQLKKLDGMVEKLLETASLDQDQIALHPEDTNVSDLLESLIERYGIMKDTRNIQTNIQSDVYAKVDRFHFENAISNLIDNAIKYGGERIEVGLEKASNKLAITVKDNGMGINQSDQRKIFDKFYRISTGNQHDVKGYGIGLYYSKKIIEKHGGEITVQSGPTFTEFKTFI